MGQVCQPAGIPRSGRLGNLRQVWHAMRPTRVLRTAVHFSTVRFKLETRLDTVIIKCCLVPGSYNPTNR